MINIVADDSLPDLSYLFKSPFQITRCKLGSDFYQKIKNYDVLLCRSSLKVDTDLLADSHISCIATVSSGTDHIVQSSRTKPVAIIDAKGANAVAVTDYVMACLAYCQQQGMVKGLRAGVIGVGAVGSAVAWRLQALGFLVSAYDPLRAEQDESFISCELEALFDCDVICIHANLHDQAPFPSRHLLNQYFLSRLKSKTLIINAARGDIVDEAALLSCRQSLRYCTDVYQSEPALNQALVDYAMICTPHIAGHSIEARRRGLQFVSQKLHAHFGLVSMSVHHDTTQCMIQSNQPNTNWQEAILSVYNPIFETLKLKQSRDLAKTFIDIRTSHSQRHEFQYFSWPEIDNSLIAAVGKNCQTR